MIRRHQSDRQIGADEVIAPEAPKSDEFAQRRKAVENEATLGALASRLEAIVGDTDGREDRISARSVRMEALRLLATARHGAEFRPGGYEAKRWSDRRQVSPQQEMDIAELRAGVPLSRHAWLEDLRTASRSNPEGSEQVTHREAFRAMLQRVSVLTAMPERDMELEHATVEMGFRFSCSSDYDGNPFSFLRVRANEAYEKREPSTVRGFGGIYGIYALGETLGFEDDKNRDRWFYACSAEGIDIQIPFNAITELPDDKDHGSLIEYAPGPRMTRIAESAYHGTRVLDTFVA